MLRCIRRWVTVKRSWGRWQSITENGFVLKVGAESAKIETPLSVQLGEKVSFEQISVNNGRPVVRLTVISQAAAPDSAGQGQARETSAQGASSVSEQPASLPDAVLARSSSHQRLQSGAILHGSPVDRSTTQGSVVLANVVSREAPSPHFPAIPQQLALNPGDQVRARVHHIVLPSTASADAATQAAAGQNAGQAVQLLAKNLIGTAGIQAALATHTTLVQQTLAGATGAVNADGLAGGQILPAVVLQSSAGGVQALVGQFQLFLPLSGQPPVGSILGLQLLQFEGQKISGVPQVLPGSHQAASLGQFLATLDRLIKVDSSGLDVPLTAAVSSSNYVSQLVPQTTASSFSPAMLLLFLAIRGKSIQSWLGSDGGDEVARTLTTEEGEKLSRDFQSLEGRARGPAGEPWRSYSLPARTQDHLDMFTLFVRDDEKGEGSKKPRGGGKRFVIEAHFSGTGQIQLDALLRDKNLLLVVRSIRDAFDDEARNDIRDIFATATAAVDLSGKIEFVHVKEFPVRQETGPGTDTDQRNEGGGILA